MMMLVIEKDFSETTSNLVGSRSSRVIEYSATQVSDEIIEPKGTLGGEYFSNVPGLQTQKEQIEATNLDEGPSATVIHSIEAVSELLFQRVYITKKQIEPEAQLIMRTYFVVNILKNIEMIQRYCGGTRSAIYAQDLFHTIRVMRDSLPFDPYVEVVLAFYDALIYHDNWLSYSPEQYEHAYCIFEELANRPRLSEAQAEKGIMELENYGFDTTPFEIESNSDNNVD